ncbi:4-coumarate--CoA ligase-like 5 [Glycine soja]
MEEQAPATGGYKVCNKMSGEEILSSNEEKYNRSQPPFGSRSGYNTRTGIYHSLIKLGIKHEIPTRPDLNTANFVLSQFPQAHLAEARIAFIDARTNLSVSYGELRRSIYSLASALFHGLEVRKGDVVFVLSPNSTLYSTICLAVLSVGAVLTTANPINTATEIAKQVHDSSAKLAISAPEELHKLVPTGVPTILTSHCSDGNMLSVEELIKGCCTSPELPQVPVAQSDTAAILYSSGTTGKYDFQAMLDAIQKHKVNNLPAVPPVILALVKHARKTRCDLSSLRRVGSGAAPLSKEVALEFRRMFPWIELRQGYGLTESSGGATFFASDKDAKAHPDSCGKLIPTFCAKVVDIEKGKPLPPHKEGELWFKSPTIMKGYLGNLEATSATIDSEGWLRTGDLGYIDENGFVYIVERIKELIKHNGYQVAPAELESVLLSHPLIVDAAVIPVEDEETGQIPMAYVVRAAGSELSENQVIQFVAGQVAPYKKVRKVSFIDTIPKSAAGKILRKDLVSQSKYQLVSNQLWGYKTGKDEGVDSLYKNKIMSRKEERSSRKDEYNKSLPPFDTRSGYDSRTGIYHSLVKLGTKHEIPTKPDLGTANFVLSQFPQAHLAEARIAFIDSGTNRSVSYGELRRSIYSLASALFNRLKVRKGDVVFVLSPNSTLYSTICLAVLSVGAVVTTANPINTESEIAKQVHDSGAKLAISTLEDLHKLVPTGIPTILTSRPFDGNMLSIEELIEDCYGSPQLPQVPVAQSDTAAILYSSGTTGRSKGVLLTHANIISIMRLLFWQVDVSGSQDDVFFAFIPMFHIYGMIFFGLGLLCIGITTVLMQKYDFQAMLVAIQKYKVNNLPAVPPVILALVKHSSKVKCDLSSLKRVGSGAAPLSKEVAQEFRRMFPSVELRQGYGLTESSGGAAFFASDKDAKAHPDSCGKLIPTFCAKVIDIETGKPLPPRKEGELWFKSPTIMKEYLGNMEETSATIDSEGWLRTGDLGYIDENGFVYIVERIKELIKHNGYQVAPAELESVLLSHPLIVDAAVIPVEDEETGQIPMAYVVIAAGSELSEDQVIQFVAGQVAPYKKVRRVSFIDTIPKSAAGKILRKDLVSQSRHQLVSNLNGSGKKKRRIDSPDTVKSEFNWVFPLEI